MYKNHEGYRDGTAGQAIERLSREERGQERNELIETLKEIAREAGFRLERVQLRDSQEN